jgi:hypothetical protein
MSDLIIDEGDGWIEISHLIPGVEFGAIETRELWAYVAAGDMESAAELLDMGLGEELEPLIGMDSIVQVKVVRVPDDVLGERLRAWVKVESVYR